MCVATASAPKFSVADEGGQERLDPGVHDAHGVAKGLRTATLENQRLLTLGGRTQTAKSLEVGLKLQTH